MKTAIQAPEPPDALAYALIASGRVIRDWSKLLEEQHLYIERGKFELWKENCAALRDLADAVKSITEFIVTLRAMREAR